MPEVQREAILKVLILDDDEVAAQTYERALRLEGFEVVTARDAEALLRGIDTDHPDVVLIDLRSPLVDGIEVIRQVRAREHLRHTPVAILTADYRAARIPENALKELGAHLFYKPLWIEHIITIARALGRRS
jgi:DNA-binding response OmpR family regulator